MDVENKKTLKEIFKDFYSVNNILLSSTVKNVNLFKKTNTLEVELNSDEQIKIRDIYNFEKYLQSRFNVKEAFIKIEKKYEDNKNYIEDEWEDIIEYISIRHPMTKVILNKSKITLNDKTLNVSLHAKGKEFLVNIL